MSLLADEGVIERQRGRGSQVLGRSGGIGEKSSINSLSSMRGGREITLRIGILLDHALDSAEAEYDEAILRGMRSVVADQKIALSLHTKKPTSTVSQYLDENQDIWQEWQALLTTAQGLDGFSAQRLQEMKIPVLSLARGFQSDLIPALEIDNFRGGYDAMAHLIQRGKQRILILDELFAQPFSAERKKGWRHSVTNTDR